MDRRNPDTYTIEQKFEDINEIEISDEGLIQMLELIGDYDKDYFCILFATFKMLNKFSELTETNGYSDCILTANNERFGIHHLNLSVAIDRGESGLYINYSDIKKIRIRKFLIWHTIKVKVVDGQKFKLLISSKVIRTKKQEENLNKLISYIKEKFKK
ncbi:MAG: hypothetical protein WCQ49_01710 [Candidatus Saccharibacteria bacterium]